MTIITITGNLAADPELRFTPSGKAVAGFTVVENIRHRNDAGEWVDGQPNYFDVDVWELDAENVAESLEKGNRVIVTGIVRTEKWEKDGQTRTKQKIRADEVAVSLKWAVAKPEKSTRSDNRN